MCWRFLMFDDWYRNLRLLTWTNLVSRRSICMRMSSQASHMHVRERCRYCSRVEMWVNLRAILVTSGRQSDNRPVSSWRTGTGTVQADYWRALIRTKTEKTGCGKWRRQPHLNVADLRVVVIRPDLCDDGERLEITGETQAATSSWYLNRTVSFNKNEQDTTDWDLTFYRWRLFGATWEF